MSITSKSAAEAVTLVHTMIAAAFNTKRLGEFSDAKVTAIEWVSVVDSTTTDECLGWNCRSTIIPVDEEGTMLEQPS